MKRNCREPAKQQNRRGKTGRDVSLSCAFYRSNFVFYLRIFNSAILLKFIHLQLSFLLISWCFVLFVISRCVAANFSILQPRPQGAFPCFGGGEDEVEHLGKIWNKKAAKMIYVSVCIYIVNTIPYGKCFVRYIRTRCFGYEISLVRCAHWSLSDTSTTRA